MPSDPKRIIRKAVVDFPWNDFGLDDVGMIGPQYAEYADALATNIAEALGLAEI